MEKNHYWKRQLKAGAVLDTLDRISEVLFGLIMVLTFTGTISVATDGKQEIRELLWAALGCNLAQGLVDAIMYLMNLMAERGHSVKVIHHIQEAQHTGESREILRSEISPVINHLLRDEKIDQINSQLKKMPSPAGTSLLTFKDFVVAGQIALLVFLCTLPVALPFGFIQEVDLAVRMSNGVALVMLFIGGYKMARYSGFRPLVTTVVYAMIGVILVAVTMALGG